MNKIQTHNHIYIYIYRILCLIFPFLLISASISCSNTNASKDDIKQFRVINNESLLSTQLMNFIGEYKVATLTINEGEAETSFDSKHSDIIPKKYYKKWSDSFNHCKTWGHSLSKWQY